MISGFGPYGAAMSRAVTARSYAQQSVQRSVNDISSDTAIDFRRNAVTAGISNKMRSNLVGWEHARQSNEKNINKLEVGLAVNEMVSGYHHELRELALAASEESLTQEDRDDYVDTWNALVRAGRNAVSGTLTNDATQDQFEVSLFGGAVTYSVGIDYVLTLQHGPDGQHETFVGSGGAVGDFKTAGMSAADFATLVDTTDTWAERLNFGHVQISGDFVDNAEGVYYSFQGALSPQRFEIAQQHVEKMADVIEGAIEKLNALDYEVESARLAKAQQQETMAMSAMQIANQGMQTYVQALANTSAAVGRLASGRF